MAIVETIEGEYLPAKRQRSGRTAGGRGIDRLTDAACRAFKASEPGKKSDGLGLFLLVKENGAKLWQWAYTHNGKANIYSIGAFPQVSLADARVERDKARKWLKTGLDPNIEKKAERARAARQQADDFRTLANEWFDKESTKWGARHAKARRRQLDTDLLPALGAIPLAELSSPEGPPHALAALKRVEQRGAFEMASKARIIGSLIARYGIVCGRMSSDPFALLGAALKQRRVEHRATVKSGEMPKLFKAIAAVPAELVTKLAFYWLALTACRTGEMRFANWGEIEGGKLWRIPAKRMKMEHEHVVPLSTQARRILKAAEPLRQSDDESALLFPGFTRHGALSENALLALLARAGFYGRQTGHGLRSSFSTWANEVHEADPDVVEACLAHRSGGVRAAYNRASYLSRRLELLEAWAGQLDAWGMKLP